MPDLIKYNAAIQTVFFLSIKTYSKHQKQSCIEFKPTFLKLIKSFKIRKNNKYCSEKNQ